MRIGVVGCAGRMGRLLVRAVLEAQAEGRAELVGAVASPNSPALGRDAGLVAEAAPCGVAVGDDPVALFADAEAVLDFTRPEAAAGFAALAAQGHVVLVQGTTGMSAEQAEAVRQAARHTPIVQAANTSLGVTLLAALVEQMAAALGERYDIEIVEMHHRHKLDAPSGTALALGRAAAAGRGVDFDAARAVKRHGKRAEGAIGFASLRGGDVVGEHTVVFAGPGERIELTHRATDRAIFARGALRAALWARGKPPGLYSMRDVLDIA